MSYKPKARKPEPPPRRPPRLKTFSRRLVRTAANRARDSWIRTREEWVRSWHSGRLGLADRYLWILLVLPLLIPAFNTVAVFSRAGYLDEWYYYSYFRHFVEFKRSLFPGTYYGTRLSWLIPGYLVNSLLPPLAANYALHMAVYYTGALSLYYILKSHYGRRAGFVGCLAFTANPYLWFSVGTDYVDGAALSIYLAGFACVTRLVRSGNRWFWLLLTGACAAALVYMNIVWLLLVPTFFFYYIYLIRPRTLKSWSRASVVFLICFGAGALAVTGILCLVNHRLDGSYWFYGPSVQFARGSANTALPWKPKRYDFSWLAGAHWLFYAGLAALVGMAHWIRRLALGRREAGGIGAFFDFNLVYFLACLLALPEYPKLPFYASCLIPAAFLAFGAHLFGRLEKVRLATALAGFAAVVFLAPWCRTGAFLWTPLSHLPLGALLALVAGLVLMGAAAPRNFAAVAAGVVGLGIFNVFLGAATGYLLSPRSRGEDGFVRMTRGMDAVDRVRRGGPILFWFDVKDPNQPEFDSINSFFLWGYSWIGREFPAIPEGIDGRLVPGYVVAVLSSTRTAEAVLREASQSLQSHGRTAEFLERDVVDYRGVAYSLTFLRLGAQGAATAQIGRRP